MKYIIAVLCLLSVTFVYAQNSSLNLSLPSPAGSYQSDRFKAGELDCTNAIGGGSIVEFGVTGIISGRQDNTTNNFTAGTPKEVGVYGRIIIPLDGPKERINCNTLYELELQKKRMEIEKLQREIDKLKNLQFEK